MAKRSKNISKARKDAPVLCDHMGRKVEFPAPREVLSATKLQTYFMRGLARVGEYDSDGISGDPIREKMVRAQVPYLVTLLVYSSKFQLEPTHREYFVYAPNELQRAAELAIRLWKRWEQPPRGEFTFGDMSDVFPKIDNGVVVEPIDDAAFAEHWKDVSKRKHQCAGNPDDPFAFTCLDRDAMLYKVTDFQAGLRVKIS